MSIHAVIARGLTKRFGDVAALAGVDLSVPSGQIFGLLGPNGAGKTTAIRILTTVIRPDSGTAEVLGIDVAKRPAAVRSRIGLAGQYAALDANLTGRENLRLIGRLTQLPGAQAAQRADELLERFGLADAGDRLVKTYSGGMRRRLDLAAALVHRPPVIFLDEPTTGLDPESRNELWEVIRELVREGATLLLTTQYLEEADRLADRVAVIDHGRVIAEGTPHELKARMGSTVIDFRFTDPATASRAMALLNGDSARAPQLTGSIIEIKADNGTRLVMDLLRRLDAGGVSPETLAVREPSLDDVFLTLTGHKVEAEDEKNDDKHGRRSRVAGGAE